MPRKRITDQYNDAVKEGELMRISKLIMPNDICEKQDRKKERDIQYEKQ